MNQRVAILDCNFPSIQIETSIVEAAGSRIVLGQCRTEDDIISLAAAVDAIIVQYAPLTARVIQNLGRCRVIARYGIGVDNIDVAAATRQGIWVTNVPGFCATELAEHTLGFVLSLGRRLPRLDRSVRAGKWDTIGVMGSTRRLSELTLGLVGFGRVGREVATRANAFGLQVLATAPRTSADEMAQHNVGKVTLDDLLQQSDFVSLHLPLTPDTRHLIGAAELQRMKPTAYLINTARGPLVDEATLIHALHEGRLAGAALDVLETEPPNPTNPLLGFADVIFSPHAGYYSDDSLAYLQTAVAEEVTRVLGGRPPRSPVNPEVIARTV